MPDTMHFFTFTFKCGCFLVIMSTFLTVCLEKGFFFIFFLPACACLFAVFLCHKIKTIINAAMSP